MLRGLVNPGAGERSDDGDVHGVSDSDREATSRGRPSEERTFDSGDSLRLAEDHDALTDEREDVRGLGDGGGISSHFSSSVRRGDAQSLSHTFGCVYLQRLQRPFVQQKSHTGGMSGIGSPGSHEVTMGVDSGAGDSVVVFLRLRNIESISILLWSGRACGRLSGDSVLQVF